MRNLMMTYLKNMGGYKYSQLKGKTYEEIHESYEKQKKRIQDFIPMDSEKEVMKDSEKKKDSISKSAKGSRKKSLARKRAGEKQKEESAKRQKTEATTEEQESAENDEEEAADYEQEKEELRMWMTIVTDEEETVDPEILSTKADGNTSYHKSLSRMLRKFDRQDLIDLHRLVMTRFEDKAPKEKRYPLIKEMLQKMLNWKLEAEAESTMAFELLKFINTLFVPTPLSKFSTRDFTMSTSSLKAEKTVYTSLTFFSDTKLDVEF
ncbi:hypothetical protein Tco_1128193 [Tanacetum coccineum]